MLRIREIRKSKEITQIELARKIGVAQATVSEWESGKIEPTMGSLIKLGQELGCSLDYLAGLTDVNIVANAG